MSDKVLCPYCGPWNGHPEGVEMDLTPIKVSGAYAREYIGYIFICPECDSYSPQKKIREETRAAAMRRFKPMQKPLTIDEMKSIEPPYPLWTEGKTTGILLPDILCAATNDVAVHFRVFGEWVEMYGKTYRCWRTRPTDEERAAADWKEE